LLHLSAVPLELIQDFQKSRDIHVQDFAERNINEAESIKTFERAFVY
jgi:hypothetical protein